MESIFSMLWNGNLKPTKEFIKNNEEIKQLEGLAKRNCEHIKN